jgi:hypothetical protein
VFVTDTSPYFPDAIMICEFVPEAFYAQCHIGLLRAKVAILSDVFPSLHNARYLNLRIGNEVIPRFVINLDSNHGRDIFHSAEVFGALAIAPYEHLDGIEHTWW